MHHKIVRDLPVRYRSRRRRWKLSSVWRVSDSIELAVLKRTSLATKMKSLPPISFSKMGWRKMTPRCKQPWPNQPLPTYQLNLSQSPSPNQKLTNNLGQINNQLPTSSNKIQQLSNSNNSQQQITPRWRTTPVLTTITTTGATTTMMVMVMVMRVLEQVLEAKVLPSSEIY